MDERSLLTDFQHEMMEFMLLTTTGPVTVDDLIEDIGGPDELAPKRANLKQLLDRLVDSGWLIKFPGLPTGRRGKPPVRYAVAPGTWEEWTKRDQARQDYLKEQQVRDDQLLA